VGERVARVDVLLVKLGSTPGLSIADDELARSLERAGARVAVADALRPPEVRTLMLTDLLWARAARRAARRMLELHAQLRPRAVIYSTTTAALLWPRPGAIRFDAPAAANRPGRHGLWQRPLERRRLRQAPLLLPCSEGALAEAVAAVPDCAARALVVPHAIDLGGGAQTLMAPHENASGAEAPAAPREDAGGGGAGASPRDIAALTYAGNPHKKGFDRVLAAWRGVRRPGERLVVVGVTREVLRAALGGELSDEDVCIAGPLPPHELRGLMRRTRVFICAPRREDYGLIQLEALADGCQLVTTPAPGAYVALALARELDPRLVGEELGGALRAALDEPLAGYTERAAKLVAPHGTVAVDRLVAEELLPRLLGSG
jgi:hypothetical protein